MAGGTLFSYTIRSAEPRRRAARSVSSSGSSLISKIVSVRSGFESSLPANQSSIRPALWGSSGSNAPPSPSASSRAMRRAAVSGQRARSRSREAFSAWASMPSDCGRIFSNLRRSAFASPADAPPVPMAISTGARSSTEGVVKSHSSGRSTTFTSSPAQRSRSASPLAASAFSCATKASRAPLSMPSCISSTTSPPARSTRRRLASAAGPVPSTMTGWPEMRWKRGRDAIMSGGKPTPLRLALAALGKSRCPSRTREG